MGDASEFVGRDSLRGACEEHHHEEDRGGAGHRPVGTPPLVAEDLEDPGEGGEIGDEHGDLVVAAEPGDAEGESGERGFGDGSLVANGAQEEEDDERGPDGAVCDVEPGGGADESGEGEEASGDDGCDAAAAEVAGEPVTEEGGLEMDEDPIPVEEGEADVAAVDERQGGEEEVEGIERSRLGLADEGLAGPDARVPERELAAVEFIGLELEARDLEVDHVGMVEPDVLAGEGEFPVEADAEGEERCWSAQMGHYVYATCTA